MESDKRRFTFSHVDRHAICEALEVYAQDCIKMEKRLKAKGNRKRAELIKWQHDNAIRLHDRLFQKKGYRREVTP